MKRIPGALVAACLIASQLPAREPVRARHAMVVAQEPIAAEAGLEILRKGGNAIDAAVAVAFVLAVTYPSAGNIGGGGFLLYRDKDGQSTFIDFRERAPAAASRDMYLDAKGQPTLDSLVGWRAAGVPGTVAGLEMAHQRFGRRRWSDLVAPAVTLASKGFELSYERARLLSSAAYARRLGGFPESRRIFLKDGQFYQPGERLIQPELARVLRRIQRLGARDFYSGETARVLAREMAANSGLITLEDLKQYRAIERKPLTGTYRGYEIVTAPPPSSGGVALLQMLGMLEGSEYEKPGWGSAASIHKVAEVMRRAYADRSQYLGDPDFFKVPVRALLDRSYLGLRRASISMDRATPSAALGPGALPSNESLDTTHFSIVDAEGNSVALTYTINATFGSGVTVPGLGFLLNNEMDDFSAKPGAPNLFGAVGGAANAIEPRKTPLSSMTPTIVARSGRPLLILGSPGGTRIINGVLQAILNVVDFGLNVQEAIDRPRIHHQWQPDRLMMDAGFSPDTISLLRAKGHEVTPSDADGIAMVQAIMVEEDKMGRWLAGAWDGRGTGKAAGY